MTAPALRRQRRRYADRLSRFVDWSPDLSLADLLAANPDADTLYTVGPAPGVDALRALSVADPGAGWSSDGHYLTLPAPVLRFRHLDGRRLEVHRAASWFGDGTYTAREAAAAHRQLGALVAGSFNEGRLLTTPASTGRYLLARCITGDRAWPVLNPDTQDLIRATTGQGRVQMFGRAGRGPLYQYDGRLMYGALCSSLPAGEPTRDTVDVFAGWHTPARYRVRFQVPKRWARECECGAPGHDGIGILPVRGADRWQYPAEAGATFDAWADGREVATALAHGWNMHIVERMLFPSPPYSAANRSNGQVSKRGPADLWANKLVRLRNGRPDTYGLPVSQLVNAAVRSILLFGIGAMHGTARKITHTVTASEARAGAIPDTARNVLPIGDRFVWTDTQPHAWPEMSHPEWTSAIWARARVALLDCATPGGRRAGMLTVPAATVVACFTDAIYMSADPEWSDDGRAGRLRPVWYDPNTDRPLPATVTELRRRKAGQ